MEQAIQEFETRKIKLLLEEVINGYRADKEIVDPIWNKGLFVNVEGSGQEDISLEKKQVH